MKKMIALFISLASLSAYANVKILETKNHMSFFSNDKISKMVEKMIAVKNYREVKAQVIYNSKDLPDHVLVYLSSKNFHKVSVSRIDLDSNYEAQNISENYSLSNEDFASQPGANVASAVCPDPSVQFIAFAPNDDSLEQQVTVETAAVAEKAHLKVIRLLKEKATRTNYLNYMSCPNLIGNFYDGDANPDLFVTVDGTISSQEMTTILIGKFRNKVTNIWLACEAYNDPMLTAVKDDAKSQVYAAGINDLLVGPSDKAAACAMQAAILGKPMKAAFEDCRKRLDDPQDQWGYGTNGSDQFGQ